VTGRRPKWLTLAAAAAVAALWIHYTAVFVVAPLVAFAASSAAFSPRQRAWFVATVGLGAACALPILASQLQVGNENGIAPYAQLTPFNLVRVLAAPFDRTYPLLSGQGFIDGSSLILSALTLLLLPGAGARLRHPRMLAVLAVIAPLALTVLTRPGRRS
jgi:hypothetical protein